MSPTTPTPPAAPALPAYTKKDFQSDQEIRWCPGCGDYAILNAVQQVMPTLGIPREKFVFVSGIGCSSRFPYYMNAYGFHTIHGRALAVATGIKLAKPDLQVWVVTGDGDGLSIGGNHMIHALRRNVDLKILLFNNRIYGLTKGQYSPTSELGKINKSAPFGTLEQPINPISLALASEATFIGRSVDIYPRHLMELLRRVSAHKGAAFVEIFQNCNVFNDKAFAAMTEKDVRDERNIQLEHGKPLVFGKNRDRGIRLNGLKPQVVKLGENGVTEKDLLIHDEHDVALAYLLSRIGHPEFPLPIGVFRAEKLPTLEERNRQQMDQVRAKLGEGDLERLLNAGDAWDVK
ncbi:MAG: 2-oxoacid:ferredoxin oxidoreductase subunit beta [Planctomycetes bacterium]|nr:2-oxoacid:ferredoxin oxidoreductase subunit beta [Planctomycetota bacterium]